jgi:hypothetical protein
MMVVALGLGMVFASCRFRKESPIQCQPVRKKGEGF